MRSIIAKVRAALAIEIMSTIEFIAETENPIAALFALGQYRPTCHIQRTFIDFCLRGICGRPGYGSDQTGHDRDVRITVVDYENTQESEAPDKLSAEDDFRSPLEQNDNQWARLREEVRCS